MAARHNKTPYIRPDPDFIPNRLLDLVTYGSKLGAVAQEDGHWPPYAMVTIPRAVQRQPQLLTRRGLKFDFLDYHEKPLGKEFCDWCGEFLDKDKFGKDSRKKNGVKTHCLKCEARQRQINRLSSIYRDHHIAA